MTFLARAALAFAVFSCLSQQVSAQQKNDLSVTRKNGIQFATADNKFLLALRFRVQSRIGYTSASDDDLTPEAFDFRIRRTRLRLDGHILDPRLTYNLQLSFSRADQDWDISNVPNVLRDAMIWYQLKKGLSIGMGQGKLPGNRQRVISSGEQQFADRSIVNNALTLDRDVGLFAYYVVDYDRFAYRIKTAITTGEGRNALPSDKGLAYTGRVELLPLGPFTERNDYFEGDLVREPRPKLSLAGTVSYDARAQRTGGQLGRILYEPRDLFNVHADVLLKYNGWALSSEYLYRHTDDPVTHDANNDVRFVVAGEGINTQLSYCTPKMWEVALRHSHLSPQKELQQDEPQVTQYGACLTKYLNKHKVKVQTDFFYERQRDAITHLKTDGSFQWRFQVELGI
ncbi:MAG: porin [Haliscomenobacteraceae bacterium CHB4]|nr:hypothetical protein [Saprospiraceae bacterium]MCE7925719.1 porin [Haliscomenobacteraceae bacterium CHB4]